MPAPLDDHETGLHRPASETMRSLRLRPARLHAARLPRLLAKVWRPRGVAKALALVARREIEQ
jgi:hypothetical protein